jgi:hypothetical protein
MFGSVMIILVPVHPQKGQSPAECSALSEGNGAFSYDAFGTACWKVYGKAVQINPLEHDIEEGFRITNFNFNANGKVIPAQSVAEISAPMALEM